MFEILVLTLTKLLVIFVAMSIDETMTLALHKDKMVSLTYANKYGDINIQHGRLVYVGKTKVIIKEPYTNDINIVRSKIKSVELV